jgi:hypothetical protein
MLYPIDLILTLVTLKRRDPRSSYVDIFLEGLDTDGRHIRLECQQATEVVIGDFNSAVRSSLSVQDISAWQLEEVKYSVSDIEHGLVAFKCLSLRVIESQPATAKA